MEEENFNDLLTPKNDVVFKRLFGKVGNERLVKDFLEAILDMKIENVILGKETQLLPEKVDEKLGILDVRVELSDGTAIDIEMQKINSGDIEKRFTYYLNRLYLSGLEKGKSYDTLNKAIVIGILDFDYFDDIPDFHTVFKMTEQNNLTKTLNEQEIHFIELPKFLRSKLNTDRKLDQWLLFIDFSRKELIELAKEKNEVIREAAVEYEYLTGEEDLQRIAWLKQKYELDQIAYKNYCERLRMEAEKAGKKAEKLEIVKNMLNKNMPVDLISEITKLSEGEIENIKNENLGTGNLGT